MSERLLLISDVITLDKIEKIVQTALKDFEGLSCYLFGSYAKEQARRSSDVDLLLLLDRKKCDYRLVHKLQGILESAFKEIEKYCRPIYGYVDEIDADSSILFRQYVAYGILMYGNDVSLFMKKETKDELKALEYSHYWMPMYLKKMQQLEEISSDKIVSFYDTLSWQYLFLALYWYAKAELTLLDKQNSLNEFTLIYIFTELLQFSLNKEEYACLDLLQRYRDSYRSGEYMENEDVSFLENFLLMKKMLK